MILPLLAACGDDSADLALAWADRFLEKHPRGTAIAQVTVGDEGVEAVLGTAWHGEDLAEWLAPCGAPPAFDVTVTLEPGVFPAELHEEVALSPCVRDRVLSFPFEGPSRRGDLALVRVRWRPGEEAPPVAVRRAASGGAPPGLFELEPPYYRSAPDADGLVAGRDLTFDEGLVRVRPGAASRIDAGPLDEPSRWARQLTCPAARLDLVRVTLAFERGALDAYEVWPENDCVEARIDDARQWMRGQQVGGIPLARAGNVLVVVDVPVGSW